MVNISSQDFSEDISADGLELYFDSDRPGGKGSYDIWVAKRAATQSSLYIGAGETLGSGSCFSGLIDDVQIYNRAIAVIV